MNNERIEYPAFGTTYVVPTITTEQYNEAMKILEQNDLGALSNENSTKLLSIALVPKGSTITVDGVTLTECWTPEIGKAQEKLFVHFPMEERVKALTFFFNGIMTIIDLTNSAFTVLPSKKKE